MAILALKLLLFPAFLAFGLFRMLLKTVVGILLGLAIVVGGLYMAGRVCGIDAGRIVEIVGGTQAERPTNAGQVARPTAAATTWPLDLSEWRAEAIATAIAKQR